MAVVIVVLIGWAAPMASARQLESPAAASRSAGAPPRPELEQRMQEVVDAGAPGIVALIDGGPGSGGSRQGDARPWMKARGVASLRSGRPMRTRLRHRVGSVTKSFVATVALQLVDEGRLSLADTVEERLPGALPYGDQVTLRQLLDHTAGVPDHVLAPVIALHRGDRFRSWQPRQLVALSASEPQLFPAGTAWSYSNTGYVLAGLMIEQATGRSLSREIRRRVLEPLRLRDTHFPTNRSRLAAPYARGYSLGIGDDARPIPGPLLDFTVHNPSYAWAAGNLVSDADDIARFYRALLSGRLLSPSRLAEMRATVATGTPDVRYGLGIFVIDTPCGPISGHTGGIPGFTTYAFSSEDTARQLGVMVNANVAPAAVSRPFMQTLEQAMLEAFAGTPCAGPAREARRGRTVSALADAGELVPPASANPAAP